MLFLHTKIFHTEMLFLTTDLCGYLHELLHIVFLKLSFDVTNLVCQIF